MKHTELKINEVYSNIFRLKTPMPNSPLRSVNAYLIKGADRNILIDTGYNTDVCADYLRECLSTLGADPERTDILLTHFHSDHAGASTSLIHESRKIYVPQQEYAFFGIQENADIYDESRRPRYLTEGLSEEYFQRIMSLRQAGSGEPDSFSQRFEPFDETSVFQAGGYRLVPLHTPGHTPGHMCFWEAEHKIMFTGDHILFDISSNIIPWPGIPNTLGIYLYSLKKLRDYDVQLALPGHREPGNMLARIDEQLEHHDQRLKECEAVIKLYPGKTALEITELITWKIRNRSNKRSIPLRLMRYAFGECLCHLDHLTLLGRVQRKLQEDDGFYHYY